MINPGLWKRAMRTGAQWRLMVLWLAGLALPAIAALFPVWYLLDHALSHSIRAQALASSLDGDALVDLLHAMSNPEVPMLAMGGGTMLLLAVVLSPILAAAAVATARSPVPLLFRELFRGAGESYGRMLRMMIVGIIPLGLAGLVSSGGFGGARRAALKAVTETSATNTGRAALALAAVVMLVAHVTLDLGRGVMAVQPDRRSALLAWWHGVRVLVRRPVAVLGFGLFTTIASLLLAALFLIVRLKIPQGRGAGVAAALLFSQLALVCIGWGRATRIAGFAELVHADQAERARIVEPPPPAAVATVPALALPSVDEPPPV